MMCFIFTFNLRKNTTLLLISNAAPVQFLEILASVLPDNDRIFVTNILWCISVQDSFNSLTTSDENG